VARPLIVVQAIQSSKKGIIVVQGHATNPLNWFIPVGLVVKEAHVFKGTQRLASHLAILSLAEQ